MIFKDPYKVLYTRHQINAPIFFVRYCAPRSICQHGAGMPDPQSDMKPHAHMRACSKHASANMRTLHALPLATYIACTVQSTCTMQLDGGYRVLAWDETNGLGASCSWPCRYLASAGYEPVCRAAIGLCVPLAAARVDRAAAWVAVCACMCACACLCMSACVRARMRASRNTEPIPRDHRRQHVFVHMPIHMCLYTYSCTSLLTSPYTRMDMRIASTRTSQ